MNYCLCSKKKNKLYKTIYKGKIRDGAYPKKTNKNFKVIVCEKCDLARLKPFPIISYESKDYRKKYNINLNIKSFKRLYGMFLFTKIHLWDRRKWSNFCSKKGSKSYVYDWPN